MNLLTMFFSLIWISVLAIQKAIKRAAKQTTDIDEMVKMVKKEVGEEAYKEVGEALVKRIVFTLAGIATAAAVASAGSATVGAGAATAHVGYENGWWG